MSSTDDKTKLVETGIGKCTDYVINKCLLEINQAHNREKIHRDIIVPMIDSIFAEVKKKLQSYLIGCSIAFVLVVLLIIALLVVQLMSRKPNKITN